MVAQGIDNCHCPGHLVLDSPSGWTARREWKEGWDGAQSPTFTVRNRPETQ